MRFVLSVCGVAIVILFGVLTHPCFAADLKASRAPDEGCTWKPFESKELGIRLLFEDCKDPNAHYVLSVKGNWLEQHRPADDVTYGSHQIIQVFSKPADQSIEEAISKNFIAKIKMKDKHAEHMARTSCQVKPLKDSPVKGNKVTLEIVPTGAYEKEVMKQLQEALEAPGDYMCGDYGKADETAYFEYHPSESKTQYAFVICGQDQPMFDENSLEFIGQ